MKRSTAIIAAIAISAAAMTTEAQDVKIKKGKATMSEEYYNELVTKAQAYEKTAAELAKAQAELAAEYTLESFVDSASYAIGRDVYNQWSQQRLGINGRAAGQAMIDLAEGHSLISDRQSHPLLQRFQQEYERKMRSGVQDNIDAGQKFMEQLSANKSVYTTPSGLKYRMIKEGNGKKPKITDRVKVHYTGTLIDGTKFDSSVDRGEPLTFGLNQVIPGWTEGLQLMDEGSKYMLYIPYNLGYGEQAAGSIPAGSTLIFEVELLQINP